MPRSKSPHDHVQDLYASTLVSFHTLAILWEKLQSVQAAESLEVKTTKMILKLRPPETQRLIGTQTRCSFGLSACKIFAIAVDYRLMAIDN